MPKIRSKGRRRYGEDDERPYQERPRYNSGVRQVTHVFPDEIIRVNVGSEPQAASEPRLKTAMMLGLVERGDIPDKKLMAAYVVLEERDTKNVYFYSSADEPFYVFYLQKGLLSEKPEMSNQKGGYLAFGNYPEPKYHRTFRTPFDENDPSSTFESHARRMIAHRVKEMNAQRAVSADIAQYKEESEHFLVLAGELFKKHGRY